MVSLRLGSFRSRSISATDRVVLDHIRRHTEEGISERSILETIPLPSNVRESSVISLEHRGHILLGINHVACLSRLRSELKKEADRNRARTARKAKQEWPFRRMVANLFPKVVIRTANPPNRPEGYTIPTAFQPLIEDPARHSSHIRKRPAEVEILAGPYYPSELGGYLQSEAEQIAAHREVWLLYTRKAAYLGIKRKVHAPVESEERGYCADRRAQGLCPECGCKPERGVHCDKCAYRLMVRKNRHSEENSGS